MTKTALITGVNGQDGSYLAELLIDKGYNVFGLVRRSSAPNFERIKSIQDKLTLISGDLTDSTSLINALRQSQPQEVYNLAAQSFVPASWEQPALTADVTGVGVLRMLDAIREVNPAIRFYQASTSEMYGNAQHSPQNEETPFRPRSPYGSAKAFAHWIVGNYRQAYKLHATCGILFNHESERRSPEFVTRKVTRTAARIKLGLQDKLPMGNLTALRDWGYAPDYVEAMWRMLQQEQPDDYVIASGQTHSIEELVEIAFLTLDLDWKKHVVQDERLMRPEDQTFVHRGDFSKARRMLGWEPSTPFAQMIARMAAKDLDIAMREAKA